MEKQVEEIIKRKIKIRNEAYANMIGEPQKYVGTKLEQEELNVIREQMYYESLRIDECACDKIYTPISSRNKLILFLKKGIRKIVFKFLGWYYVPIIEGQVECNMQIKYLLQDMQKIIDSQQEQINELENAIKNLDKDIK